MQTDAKIISKVVRNGLRVYDPMAKRMDGAAFVVMVAITICAPITMRSIASLQPMQKAASRLNKAATRRDRRGRTRGMAGSRGVREGS